MKKNARRFLFEEVISLTPINIYWKNKQGVYLGCNLRNAITCGCDSPSDMIGKKLEHIFSDNKIRNALKKVDDKVISQNKIFVGEEQGYDLNGKKAIYSSRKIPLQNKKGEPIGLIGFSIDITNQKKLFLSRENHKAERTKKSFFYRSLENKSSSFKELFNKKFNQEKYILPEKYKGVYLTHREVQCLAYLTSGYSAKRIAQLFNISYRTVESHLATIRTKLYCRTRSELISTVIEEKLLDKISSAQS